VVVVIIIHYPCHYGWHNLFHINPLIIVGLISNHSLYHCDQLIYKLFSLSKEIFHLITFFYPKNIFHMISFCCTENIFHLIPFSYLESILHMVLFSHSRIIFNCTHCLLYLFIIFMLIIHLLIISHNYSSHWYYIHLLPSISQSLTFINFIFVYFSSILHSYTHIIFTFT